MHLTVCYAPGKYNHNNSAITHNDACALCGVGTFSQIEGQSACTMRCRFNNMEGQSDEVVACMTTVSANSTL